MIIKKNKEITNGLGMKVAFFETEKWEEEFLSERLSGHTLSFSQKEFTAQSAKKVRDAEAIGVFIYSQINEKVLGELPALKFIATMSTGYDHIGLRECEKRGIVVSNVPTYGENTVAEHTFALLLSISRKIHESYERTRKADFSAAGLRGFDLKGKTIGIVGCGNIGKHVARIAHGFEMKILVHERTPDMGLASKLGFTTVTLDELYSKSDIITFHVPLNESTRHMFGMDSLRKVKKGCVVINTSRGEVVDTAALIKGLENKTIAGAGLDVLEGECFIREEKQVLSRNFPKECDLKSVLQNHVLLGFPNVLITPHNAFNSREALERILSTTIGNIEAFAKGKPTNVVK